MNYVLIESFCALARTLNFTEAASEIFISQPSLSRNISMLENEVGFQLFHRSRHSVSLTDLGKQLLPYAQGIKRANDEAEDFVAGITKNVPKGASLKEVRIGVATLQFTDFLPDMIAYMSAHLPTIRFSVSDGLQEEILQQLNKKQLDMIFTEGSSLTDRAALTTRLLDRSDLKLVLPKSHPLAASPSPIPLSVLPEIGLPLLTVDKTVHHQIRELFPTIEIKQFKSALRVLTMIEGGLGFSICHEGMRPQFPSTLEFKDIEGSPLHMEATIAWLEDPNAPLWWNRFIAVLSEYIKKYTAKEK